MNPFAGMSIGEAYWALTDPDRTDIPNWPDEKLQKGYAGWSGPGLLKRALAFVDVLDRNGAFTEDWRGLDYGCGWGRFASILLSKGLPEQLDLVDAWQQTIGLLERGNFKNRRWLVSERLTDRDIPTEHYDFIMSFSVFTHFPRDIFLHNIERLVRALTSGGKLYFTVRHEEFIDHVYGDHADAIRADLAETGFWYAPTVKPAFGNTVVGPRFIAELGSNYGPVRYLGNPNDFQHVYSLTN